MARSATQAMARSSITVFLMALAGYSATAQFRTCLPSERGYQCKLPLPCGRNMHAALHWSIGGHGPPVSPGCQFLDMSHDNGTLAAILQLDEITAIGGDIGATMLHMALEVQGEHGYIAMAVPKHPGRMVPADAIVGAVEDVYLPSVAAHHLQSYHEAGSNEVDHTYALNDVQVVKRDGHMVMCFSRAIGAVGKGDIKWSPYDLPLNVAVGKEDHLSRHEHHCSLETISLEAVHGDVQQVMDEEEEDKWGEDGDEDHHHHHHYQHHHHEAKPVIHGWLMIITWTLLIPLGMLATQYRDVMATLPLPFDPAPNGKVHTPLFGSPVSMWFLIHQLTQWSSVALFLISFIVVLSHDDWSVAQPSGAVRAHSGIGVTVLITLLLHVLVALVRPVPDATHRPVWQTVHAWGARLNMGLAAINVLMGPKIYCDATGDMASAALMYIGMGLLFAIVAVSMLLCHQQQANMGSGRKLFSEGGSERQVLLADVNYESVAGDDMGL